MVPRLGHSTQQAFLRPVSHVKTGHRNGPKIFFSKCQVEQNCNNTFAGQQGGQTQNSSSVSTSKTQLKNPAETSHPMPTRNLLQRPGRTGVPNALDQADQVLKHVSNRSVLLSPLGKSPAVKVCAALIENASANCL